MELFYIATRAYSKDPYLRDVIQDIERNERLLLFYAKNKGSYSKMKILLDKGIDPNCYDNFLGGYDTSPLMVAAKYGDEKHITLLLQYGADVNYKSLISDYTALHLAIQRLNNNYDIIVMLMKYGADINIHCRGLTSLELAKLTHKNPEHDIIKLLEKKNCRRNCITRL